MLSLKGHRAPSAASTSAILSICCLIVSFNTFTYNSSEVRTTGDLWRTEPAEINYLPKSHVLDVSPSWRVSPSIY